MKREKGSPDAREHMSEEDAKAPAWAHGTNVREQDLDPLRQGLQNLSVAVMDPTGKETLLNFQWARLHPATVIACSEDSNSPIVELSRKFHEYQDAAIQRKAENGTGEDETAYRPALLTASDVTIDLCELLPDPPLMSEHVDAMFDDDNADTGTAKKPRSNHPPLIDSSADMGTLLDRVMDYSVRLLSTPGADIDNRRLAFDLSTLARSQENLFDLLPASLILTRLEEIASSTNVGTKARSMLVTVLIALAECGACETMSRYILQHLAPGMLVTCKVDSADTQSAMKRLAKALVVSCGLGARGRHELVSLTTVEKEYDSDAYRELVTCLGECYFEEKDQI
jgi:hypothetical protein